MSAASGFGINLLSTDLASTLLCTLVIIHDWFGLLLECGLNVYVIILQPEERSAWQPPSPLPCLKPVTASLLSRQCPVFSKRGFKMVGAPRQPTLYRSGSQIQCQPSSQEWREALLYCLTALDWADAESLSQTSGQLLPHFRIIIYGVKSDQKQERSSEMMKNMPTGSFNMNLLLHSCSKYHFAKLNYESENFKSSNTFWKEVSSQN